METNTSYEVHSVFYFYNTGMADNGRSRIKTTFSSLLAAQDEKKRIVKLIETNEGIPEEGDELDGDGFYVNCPVQILQITRTLIE